MARDVDPRRTRKAQRLIDKLQRERDAAAQPYSGWEDVFLSEVGQRLEKYGSAFRDLAKGAPDAALSNLQTQKLKEIAAKAAGKDKQSRAEAKAARARARGGGDETEPERPAFKPRSSFRSRKRPGGP